MNKKYFIIFVVIVLLVVGAYLIFKNKGLDKPVKPDGIMIVRVIEGDYYHKLGLISGDLIKTVNGKKYSNLDEINALFSTLATDDKIEVVAVRAGQPQTFTYTLTEDDPEPTPTPIKPKNSFVFPPKSTPQPTPTPTPKLDESFEESQNMQQPTKEKVVTPQPHLKPKKTPKKLINVDEN